MQFFIFKTKRCVSVKIFYTNTLLFLCPARYSATLKTLYMLLHSTKKLKKMLTTSLLTRKVNRHPVYFLKEVTCHDAFCA